MSKGRVCPAVWGMKQMENEPSLKLTTMATMNDQCSLMKKNTFLITHFNTILSVHSRGRGWISPKKKKEVEVGSPRQPDETNRYGLRQVEGKKFKFLFFLVEEIQIPFFFWSTEIQIP